jgi:hypothetical protein
VNVLFAVGRLRDRLFATPYAKGILFFNNLAKGVAILQGTANANRRTHFRIPRGFHFKT